jgi:hypothetical protein
MSAWLERFRPALNELGAYNPRGYGAGGGPCPRDTVRD